MVRDSASGCLGPASGSNSPLTVESREHSRDARRVSEKLVVSHLPVKNLQITLRGAGNVSRIRSLILERDLAVRTASESVIVTLPQLAEGISWCSTCSTDKVQTADELLTRRTRS